MPISRRVAHSPTAASLLIPCARAYTRSRRPSVRKLLESVAAEDESLGSEGPGHFRFDVSAIRWFRMVDPARVERDESRIAWGQNWVSHQALSPSATSMSS